MPKKKPREKYPKTSASVVIDCHYSKLRVQKIWNKQRTERLCSFLRMTYSELGALVGYPRLGEKCIGAKLPLSVCLLLTLVENQYMQDWSSDTIPNLFNFTE